QYVMPMDYSFDYLAFDSSLFTEEEQKNIVENSTYTYDELIKTAEKPFERANTDPKEPIRMFGASGYSKQQPSMFSEMLQQNYGAFVDMENKKVNLADGGFADLMKSLKTYGENGYFPPNSDSMESRTISIEDFKKLREEQFFYKIKNHFSFLSNALEKSGSKVMMAFGAMSAGNEDHDKTLGLLASDNGEVSFNYTQAYGINSNSDNKALSWAFIKYLMSKEMQAKLEFTRIGLPINNAARLEKAKIDITGISFNKNAVQMPTSESIALNESQQAALDQYVKTIEDFSDLLNYCPIKDDTVNTMINDEVSRYFDGSKTAEEVAETLQEKIELYLNE
ncbi:MAG TPA: extracellular solute-binding protein, partial [Anaerovoracaceae bacterium]|nr:extracellular solute-binding protein [Anaerovoracaceae bacterium]